MKKMPNFPTRYEEVEAVVQAAAYAAGDAFGERLDFVGALRETKKSLGGVLLSLTITALNTSTPAIDVIFFDDVFQAGGDNDPSSFTDEDLGDKCIGKVSVASSDWSVFANNAVATVPINFPIQVVNSPGTIYAQMVTRSIVTPGSTSDYTVKLGIIKDYS
jgi:hypothetical protein